MCMCGCWSRYNIIYIFSIKITYVFYSRYIHYFSKPWGCFVCKCMCNFISKIFRNFFLSLEAVFVCMYMCVSWGCVGRVG